jgi:hypothetical protein
MEELQSSTAMCYWEDVLMTFVNDAKSTQNNTKTCLPGGIFTCFSRLPFELRWTIWIFALPGHRPVFIKARPKIPRIHKSGSLDYVRLIATPPALLHTSHESREVALEFYELSFGGVSYDHPVYIDFQMDILYLKGRGSVACLRDKIEILDGPLYPDYYPDTPKDQNRRYIGGNVRCIVFDSMAVTGLTHLVNNYSGFYKLECIVLLDPEAGDEGLSYRRYDFDNRLELLKNAGCHWSRLVRERAGGMVGTWKLSLKDGEKAPEILLMKTEVLESIVPPTTTR